MSARAPRPLTLVGGAVGALVAAPGALAAVHLSALSLASLLPAAPATNDGRPRRLLVVIAARNEELLIARAVAPLVAQRRPDDIVLVVADRCTDATAACAAAAGAEVLERPPGSAPGKGAAISDGLAACAARTWDALVTIDADSVVGPGFLAACERALQAGAAAAQGRSEALPGRGPLSHAAIIAAALQGIVLARGRDRLGLGVRLKGPGMVVRRDVLARHPFPTVGSSEDSRYGMTLVKAGILPRHVDDARVRSESSRRLRTASRQRTRWEAGRLHLARHEVGGLVRVASPSSLDAALHLATPPVAVAVLSLAGGASIAAVAGARRVAAVPACLMGAVAADVVLALVATRAGPRTWAALAAAPAYVVWKSVLQVRALLTVGSAATAFEPTRRD